MEVFYYQYQREELNLLNNKQTDDLIKLMRFPKVQKVLTNETLHYPRNMFAPSWPTVPTSVYHNTKHTFLITTNKQRKSLNILKGIIF